MDIPSKTERTIPWIRSIVEHTDAPGDLRKAALEKLRKVIDKGIEDVEAQVAKAIEDAFPSEEVTPIEAPEAEES